MLESLPLIFVGVILGSISGYTMGLYARKDRYVAAASEEELLREVRNRRMKARLYDEIERQVDQEAGPKPTSF